MKFLSSLRWNSYQKLIVLLIISIFVRTGLSLKFHLRAQPVSVALSHERCIRNFVLKDQLVVVTVITNGERRDGQTMNIHIRDAVGNDYAKPKDVVGENRYAFTSHSDSAFDVCFHNILEPYNIIPNAFRDIELGIDIGADAKDWSAIQASEKLKPVETELKRIEEAMRELVSEMDYLRVREQKLRDTNESTNARVKWFSFSTMAIIVGLVIWQIMYLRAYFRSKHLI